MRRIVLIPVLSLVAVVSLSGCGLFKKKSPSTAADMGMSYDDSAYSAAPATSTPAYQDSYTYPAGGTFASGTSGSRTHTVQRKETLYSLARTYYNDQSRWKDIYEANRAEIGDPNKIRVGQRLVIP